MVCRPEDNFSVTADAIAKVITPKSKVLVLNFPTNPTGGTMSRAELQKIADLVLKHNLLVITDEIYSELTFEGEHVSIASLPGMVERTIFLHGFSKAYAMTGFRIGYACGPTEIIEAMMKIHQYSMLCASIISQEAAIDAIQYGEPDMLRMREQYKLRRNLHRQLAEQPWVDVPPAARARSTRFPCIRSSGLTSKDFALKFLEQEKVACVPGPAFGPSGEGFVRCCFATSLEQLEVAMQRLGRFMGRLKNG